MALKYLTPLLAASASLAFATLASPVLAAPTTYTTALAFGSATSLAAIDTFDDLSNTATSAAPLTRTAGPWAYTIGTSDQGALFGAGSVSDHWLSVDNATTRIVFSGFSTGVMAIGGYFFGSDIWGSFAPGAVRLVATDATGSTTWTLDDPSTTSFVGFVATRPLLSLTVTSVQPASATLLWPTVNNLVLAAAVAPVPEPGNGALLLVGLGALGLLVHRRGLSSVR